MKLSYITNIPYTETSGGGSGVNNATIHQLKQHFEISQNKAINPGYDTIAKFKSAILKKVSLKRNYHFFSEHRLNKISVLFKHSMKNIDIDAYFFHGFTPWIKTVPNRPYFCFNDACFATYVDIYNNKNEFSTKDLKRIFRQESMWLAKASSVFFRSQWALEQTQKHYQLKGENFHNVGVGGFIDIPTTDTYSSGLNFLFISREFIPKGGIIVAEAFKTVKKSHPTAKLWIAGERPPESVLATKDIEYKGFLRKSNAAEKELLVNLFKNSFCLVHPTLKDTNTLVINELAYYGCPALASNRFAIPEYLLDEKTGFLLNDPTNSDELALKMIRMIENKKRYKSMRIEARRNALENNTWDKVGERMAKVITECIK